MYTNTPMKTAEAVSMYHPDKICDQISDFLLDIYVQEDKTSRVAIETCGGHGKIFITGEVTSRLKLSNTQIIKLVKDFYEKNFGEEISVLANIVNQSTDIAQGVDTGGAGDQGIMIGYATKENNFYVPNEYLTARNLVDHFDTDAKAQITINNLGEITKGVLSVQGKTQEELTTFLRKNNLPPRTFYINNTGKFDIGGFDADAGCTGRKIVQDAYGPRIPVGGGAFSGKDPTKVDRSAAYMARAIAITELLKLGVDEVFVTLAYAIGEPTPVHAEAKLVSNTKVHYKDIKKDYDLCPQAIIEQLHLLNTKYLFTAKRGHFINKEFAWNNSLS